MKTEDLVIRLSQEEPRPTRWSPATALTIATLATSVIVVVFSVLWLAPRADLVTALTANDHTVLWKFVFAFGVVVTALPLVRDLTTPGRAAGIASLIALLPFAIVAVLGAREVVMLPATELRQQLSHASWGACLWQVPLLSIPAFAILVVLARRLAPTNLTRAGAYIGLMAGGFGAVGYALHCGDDSMLFVATVYTLAIGEMAFLGALLGPRLLRWT
jgi:hypothetical protein